MASDVVSLSWQLLDDIAVKTALIGITNVALVERQELALTVEVPVVMPFGKQRHPLAGLDLFGKRPSRLVR